MFYLLIWFPVAFLGGLLTVMVLALATYLELKGLPDGIVWLLNVVPAFIWGVWCYFRAGTHARVRATRASPRPGHLRRAMSLYLIAAALAIVIAANWSDPGFGLAAQLFVWPLMVTVGGILGDALAGRGPTRVHSDSSSWLIPEES